MSQRDCRSVHNLLYEYVDKQWCGCCDEIENFQQVMGLLQQHLTCCPECQRSVDAEVHVRQVLRQACTENAPESLRMRVVSVVRSELG